MRTHTRTTATVIDNSEQYFPAQFLERIRTDDRINADALIASHTQPAPTAVLLNSDKTSTSPFADSLSVPWNNYGHYLPFRPDFSLDPLWHSGAYYVMEPSSMAISLALQDIIDFQSQNRILDLCAAPGGKTMVASNMLRPQDLLLCNEIIGKRYKILVENTVKRGHPNIWTTKTDPSRILLDAYFNIILVDAPCSGEGLFRKNPDARKEWSLSNTEHCAMRQKRILSDAVRLLEPGGYLIYSTCTYNPEENMRQLEWLAREYGMEPSGIQCPPGTGIIELFGKNNTVGYQCFPHLVEGEGFFFGRMRKPEKPSASAQPQLPKRSIRSRRGKKSHRGSRGKPTLTAFNKYLSNPDSHTILNENSNTYFAVKTGLIDKYSELQKGLPNIRPGLLLGEVKGTHVVPSHELALSIELSDEIPTLRVEHNDAVAYLRKEALNMAGDHSGWLAIAHRSLVIGWAKQTPAGLKNYFPTHLRIRK